VQNDDKLVYENQIYHYSSSLPGVGITEITKAWSEGSYQAATEAICAGISNTILIAQQDIKNSNLNGGESTSIRLKTERGIYSDRGTVMADENNRLTYKTVSKEIKSVGYTSRLSFPEYARLMHPAGKTQSADKANAEKK